MGNKAEEKKKKGYKAGDMKKGTTVDLNAVNFRNKEVVKWSKKSYETGKQSGSSRVPGLKTLHTIFVKK